MNAFVTNSGPAQNPLTDAFAAFISAANRLENSHWQLHDEVAQLRMQLEERNRALASSQAENERIRILLRQVLDALPCGVAVLDCQGEEVVLLNPEARQLLDIAQTKTLGWMDIPERVRTLVKGLSWHTLKQGDEQEFCVEEASAKRWLTVRASAMDPETGEANDATASRRVILIFRDTTAHKQAEQERESSRHMMALAEMATVLAHEIRNPLGSLELLTGLLASDSGLSDDSRQWVQSLRAGVRSLSVTVNNVLQYYSLGTPTLAPMRLGEALKSSVEFVRPLAQQNGVTLLVNLPLGDVEIVGDPGSLQQVILNLACNALRHTPADGKITVSARLEARDAARAAVVEFTDNGSGIRPEDLAHIFEAGFTTTRQSPGLGLTICQRIVEQHHGSIAVQSEPGKGTTFRMEFPVL
ncbi:MAG: PAS domain-containing sensor histidine kinase [Terriglobales bacterium]